MNLSFDFRTEIAGTFIIRLKNNPNSERLALRCLHSCSQIQQPNIYLFDAINGPEDPQVFEHPSLTLLKQPNSTLTREEVGCFLSHYLLWVKCIEMGSPLVILEHDAIMVQPYSHHPFLNMLGYLGCWEQFAHHLQPQFPLPPHGQLTPDYRFILRTHAYALDPLMAKRLVAKAIGGGITASVDIFMRIDEFAVIQPGFFAYDGPVEQTSIPGRSVFENSEEFKKLRFTLLQN